MENLKSAFSLKLGLVFCLPLIILAACESAGGIPEQGVDSVPEQSAGGIPGQGLDSASEEGLPPDAAGTRPDPIETLLARMTLEEKIGQLIISRVPRDIGAYIRDYHMGGFILFSGDVESEAQVRALTSRIQDEASAANGIPLFISIDEEGGSVSRIGKLYGNDIPPMMEIGKTGDAQKAYDAAFTIGKRLKNLGVNMDFAPVADIWSNKRNTVIGSRAFAGDAETAALMVASAVRGFHDAGVLSVVKHFPGHGDTVQDSHRQIAVYPHRRERFDNTESLPFTSGIAAGADGVMVGHIATPEMQNSGAVLDWMYPWLNRGNLPASFSDYWMRDVLRGDMRYDALIITDGLEMGALTRNFSAERIALGVFMAGADILLIPPDVPGAVAALTEAYRDGTITAERLDESVRRILRAKLNGGILK